MKRRHRLLLVFATIAGCVAAGVLLTSFSRGTEGPISSSLGRLGAAIGGVEQAARRRLSGPGRAGKLAWFERYRRDIEMLRRPDSVLLGVFDGALPQSLAGIPEIERQIGATMPIVQVYTAWGDKPDQQFPLRLVSAIWDFGSVPMITWEPWLTDFSNDRHPHLPLRDARESHGMAGVARGDYDFYIDAWAAEAKRFGRPLLVRFAHEMNDPYRYPWGPQNNSKEEYIAAWRHVVERFRGAGATNVLWVWSPHVAYEYWELYYPGGTHVDWVATGVLNYGPIAQWSRWWSFTEIFGTKYPALAAFRKPVMVAEFGSLAVGGDRAAWYRDALSQLPAAYPAVRAVVFFHTRDDQTITYQKVDWTVTSDSLVARAVADAVRGWAPGDSPKGSAPR